MMRLPWHPLPPMPDANTLRPALVLLASEGRAISADAVRTAANLAKPGGGAVKVLTIARIWGSALGLPHPGLRPNKQEWQAQREIVEAALAGLSKRGIAATGEVLGSRNAAGAILRHAAAAKADAIVMAADTAPHWLQRGLLWSHLPHVVARKSKLPVYLVGPA